MTLPQAALDYARLGFAVFPLRPRSKQPYGRTSGLLAGSSDLALVGQWWAGQAPLPLKDEAEDRTPVRPRPDSNIGLATGARSGVWVFDIDGAEAAASLAALEAVNGALPPTPEQTTANGRHLFFRWPAGGGIRNSASKLDKGLDVRGEGGYVLVAPSVHPGSPEKGIPPGRLYAWREGRSPQDLPMADAPAWLLALVLPDPEPTAPRRAVAHQRQDGRASAYGEAALSGAVRRITTAGTGTRDSTVWNTALSIGSLVAGGEIEERYAAAALTDAGGVHVPSAFTLKALVDKIERAFEFAQAQPKTAPERRSSASASPSRPSAALRPAAGQQAAAIMDARGLWDSARPADCRPLNHWLSARGLSLRDFPGLFDSVRVHPRAPWGRGNEGPALIAPMWARIGEPVSAVAVLALHPDCERFCHFLGDPAGRAVLLSPGRSVAERPLVVAIDLQDGWRLGAVAHAKDRPVEVAIAPTLRSFAGGALGDQFGRVNVEQPRADPAAPPWLWPDAREVALAVRRDLRSPELKVRGAGGRTLRRSLEGEAAARFWGSIAEQAWRRGGAHAVRILKPRGGAGFNSFSEQQRGAA